MDSNFRRLFIESATDCTSAPGRTTSWWSLWPVRTSARRTLRRTRSRRRWCWRKSPAACRPGTVKLRTTWKKQDVSVWHLCFIGILNAHFRFLILDEETPILWTFNKLVITSFWMQMVFTSRVGSHQWKQIPSTLPCYLKYLVFKSIEKCKWIEFDNSSDYRWL